nr:neuroligin-4, X-linked-like [Parasteatoda tepidariorum]
MCRQRKSSCKRIRLRVILRFTLLISVTFATTGDTKKISSRVVTTKYGSLRGFVKTFPNRQWRPVEIFLGVPYARPPINTLRFMHPVTPAQWRGVQQADEFKAVCIQKLPDIKNETEALKRMPVGRIEYLKRLLPLLKNQSEDCLYLNIYAPATGKLFFIDFINLFVINLGK